MPTVPISSLLTLKLFLRTVDMASISGAGRAYGMSSTSASRRLQDLEAQLGVQLLERSTRYVAPTEAGQRLYQRISPSVNGIEEALRDVRESDDKPMGSLRVLARRSFGALHIAPALPRFLTDHPLLEVDLELTEDLDIVPGQGIDVVIRHGRPSEKSMVSYPLASGARVMCASPAYVKRNGAPGGIEELVNHPCLTYRKAHEAATWVFESTGSRRGGEAGTPGPAKRQEIRVEGPLQSTDGYVLCQAASAGLGLALLPAWMVRDHLASGKLVQCLPDISAWPAGFDDEIVAVHRRARPVPQKIAAFIAHLLSLNLNESL